MEKPAVIPIEILEKDPLSRTRKIEKAIAILMKEVRNMFINLRKMRKPILP